MKSKTIWILLWIFILTCAAAFRMTGLNSRPMHTDESVHAQKFGALLEEGVYIYDPHEFHGPTLNFCTLASAFLRGEQRYEQIEELTLRLVPAVFGTLLVLTPIFFTAGIGRRAALYSAILLAFSPAFVYYSRYYIQEMLLVFFTACFFGCLWQYLLRQKLHWMIFAGCFVGLMHASKETFVFSIGAASIAALFAVWRQRLKVSVRFGHISAGIISYVAISAAFYSSFGANPKGVIDSVTTYGIWFQRAGGDSVHIHPWYYYLDLLTWLEFLEPLAWNEDGIVALALIGIISVLLRRPAKRWSAAVFLGLYTLILTAIYCSIPYKTPWSMLSFLYGMAIVAGWTADRMLQLAGGGLLKLIFAAVLLVYGLISPAIQSKMLAFDLASDPSNPYVYAHTGADIFPMVQNVKNAANASEQGRDAVIQVIAEGDDYWPLPWYLRDFKKVGYWNHIDPSAVNASIILAQQKLEQPLLRMLYSSPPPGQRNLYLPLFDDSIALRPGVSWQGYIRKDLWDRMNQQAVHNESVNSKSRFMEVQSGKENIKDLLKFSHNAMNSVFEIFIQHQDASYASQAARLAFDEVDRLENLLSRFIENSDISRINASKTGDSIVVDPDTMQCLLSAKRAYDLTAGAFDVNFRGRLEKVAAEPNEPNELGFPLKFNPETSEVKLLADVDLDMGGIGKGFAVDKISHVLKDWSITKSFIHGGASSVCAMQQPDARAGWPITISNPVTGRTYTKLALKDEVLSSSGLTKGPHIIDPATGNPAEGRLGAWVRLPANAALADTLSTAAIIMPIEELRILQQSIEGCSILLLIDVNGLTKWVHLGDDFGRVY